MDGTGSNWIEKELSRDGAGEGYKRKKASVQVGRNQVFPF